MHSARLPEHLLGARLAKAFEPGPAGRPFAAMPGGVDAAGNVHLVTAQNDFGHIDKSDRVG